MTSDSYPFLHLSKQLRIPYADVLLFAECIEGIPREGWVPTPHHRQAVENLTSDLSARNSIIAALDNELKRREAIMDRSKSGQTA